MDNNQVPKTELFKGRPQAFNFNLYFAKLLLNWYWIIISVIVCMAAGFLYLKYTTPVYKATATVLIADNDQSGLGKNALLRDAMPSGYSRNTVNNSAQLFQARSLMEKVVKRMNANIIFYKKGRFRTEELFLPPFSIRLIQPLKKIRGAYYGFHINNHKVYLSGDEGEREITLFTPFDLEGVGKVQFESSLSGTGKGEYFFRIIPVDAAVGMFRGNLNVVQPDKMVDVLNLSITHSVPEKAEALLTQVIQTYINSTIADKNRIADSTIAFIENRLRLVSQELGSVEGSIQSFRQKNRLANLEEQSSLLINSTNEYDKQLLEIETQLNILQSLESYLADAAHQRVVPGGVLPDNPVFAGLVERYNALLLERERSSLSQTADNPYVKSLDNQLSAARTDMLANIRNTRNSLLISRKNLENKARVLEGQIVSVPSKERNFLDMSRQQQVKQDLYVYLLQKREETAISKTSNVSNCQVIDTPKAFGPIKPVRNNVLAYCFLLGLIFPASFIFLSMWFTTRIQSKEDITNNTSVSIVGEIGTNNGHQTLVVEKDARTPISEQFRALRTNLSFFLKEDEKTILLTSSMSGEGKSFVSLNLAAILAVSGKKVVIMEMDLRKPNLSNKLNIPNNFGFTNYIISPGVLPIDIVKESGVQNLYLISSGPIPPNPAETILSKRTQDLMAYLKATFDYVIIDAPPVGVVTDAQLLSRYADLTLYLVRQRYTFKNQLFIPQDLYENHKMKKIALVVNDVKISGGYGYGYGYGYGDYVKEERGFSLRKILKKST